jgi:hypothetical protein
MGSILISVPDISDSELIYDEIETRKILKFFWPHLALGIDKMAVNNDTRRLAQTALVAAIDGSYPMSYIEATFKATFFPLSKDIKSLAKKLAFHYMKNWWKNVKKRDALENVQIYDTVRKVIAENLKFRLDSNINGVSIRRGPAVFYAHVQTITTILS